MKRRKLLKLGLFAVLAAAAAAGLRVLDMYRLARLPLPARSAPESAAAKRIAADVRILAGDIGPRNYAHPAALARAEAHMKSSLKRAGYAVAEQPYMVRPPGMAADVPMRNFTATLHGAKPGAPVLVIGAHYDTALETPGADDNASGSAVLLELARRFAHKRPEAVEVRFVAYGTEEPPFFGTKQMGSAFHARALKAEGLPVVGMISLEMLGYYNDAPGSQKYPPVLSLFYPDKANYVGAVSDLSSRAFLRAFAKVFTPAGVPVVAASLPGWITEIGLSDHKSYWDEGFPGLILTDTSFLRYTHYHMTTDTPEKLDYERMAAVADGLEAAIESLRKGS
ncbi:MAG: M28 family peptidase [Elusimicrobia bacterium]|nr:M28 family peptidase [Elusimicrobiota bacterium]